MYKLSLRGMGVLNSEGPSVTGEHWFVNELHDKGVPIKVVVDVGANTGEFSLEMTQAFSQTKIYSCEPNPNTFKKLKKNVANHPNITPINKGMSSSTRKAKLWDFADDAELKATQPTSTLATLHKDVMDSFHKQKTTPVDVSLSTLDAVARTHKIEYIDFLKIDTEGHELEVLQGAKRLLTKDKVGIVQFEFNEMNVYSRIFLHDFITLLPNHTFYRLLPTGMVALGEYRPLTHEIIAFQNIVALPSGMKL